jgi:hypothetical protein
MHECIRKPVKIFLIKIFNKNNIKNFLGKKPCSRAKKKKTNILIKSLTALTKQVKI